MTKSRSHQEKVRIAGVGLALHQVIDCSLYKPFTVVIADSLPLVSEGLSALCQGIPQCNVLGYCSEGEEAWSMLSRMQPDIALVDSHLPQMMTAEILRRAARLKLGARIVILASRPDPQRVMESLRMGASGYLLKTCGARQLEDAFRQVLSGSLCVFPSTELQKIVDETIQKSDPPLGVLSLREHQVFTLLVEGIKAKEIASRLALSPKTIDTYRASLMRKLSIHSVPGLVKFAIQHKVTALES